MKKRIITISILTSLCLFGCGKVTEDEKELAEFSTSMSTFTESIKEANTKINELDSSDKDSVKELLNILDDMDKDFKKIADIDAPLQYEGVEQLAIEASNYMSEAVSNYHIAYEGDTFDDYAASEAFQYYKWAMTRIEYIGYIISGDEMPENDHVTVYEESNDGNILDKWLQDSEKEDTTMISTE